MSPGAPGMSSSIARIGVIPMPPAIRATRGRRRASGVNDPYGPSARTRVPGGHEGARSAWGGGGVREVPRRRGRAGAGAREGRARGGARGGGGGGARAPPGGAGDPPPPRGGPRGGGGEGVASGGAGGVAPLSL